MERSIGMLEDRPSRRMMSCCSLVGMKAWMLCYKDFWRSGKASLG